jgi:hypothetical protein
MATETSCIRAADRAHVYCHVCGSIQPLIVDEPQRATDGPYDHATDLVCGGCQFVVATTYALRSSASRKRGLLKAA